MKPKPVGASSIALTEPTPLEHHLYSIGSTVRASASLRRPVTRTHSMAPAARTIWIPVQPGQPPRTTLHSGDGAELGVYREADRALLEQFEILPTEIVKFNLPDGRCSTGA